MPVDAGLLPHLALEAHPERVAHLVDEHIVCGPPAGLAGAAPQLERQAPLELRVDVHLQTRPQQGLAEVVASPRHVPTLAAQVGKPSGQFVELLGQALEVLERCGARGICGDTLPRLELELPVLDAAVELVDLLAETAQLVVPLVHLIGVGVQQANLSLANPRRHAQGDAPLVEPVGQTPYDQAVLAQDKRGLAHAGDGASVAIDLGLRDGRGHVDGFHALRPSTTPSCRRYHM